MLQGGLGTLQLALLGQLPRNVPTMEAMEPILRRIERRISEEATSGDQARLLTATYVLSGLRLVLEDADLLFRRVVQMKESTTYQGILEEGRIDALQKTLLRQGKHRFGPVTRAVRAAVQ